MFQGQFNAIANQWFTLKQLGFGCIINPSKGRNKPNSGSIAPNQNRAAGHQINIDALAQNNPLIARGIMRYHCFKIRKSKRRITERMGQIQDRIIRILAMNALQRDLLFRV